MTTPRFDFARDVDLTEAKPDILPRDSHVTEPAELRRLSGQSRRILERLQRGPATNRELASLSLKYTGRISDLRAAGYDVKADRKQGGLTVYRLGEKC